MATPISKSEIKNLPVTNYSKLRPNLMTGDLLFASGDYLVSKAIQSVTKSPWSHVGIIFKIEALDRVLLLESVEDMGVRFAPLSKYVENYEAGRPYRGPLVAARISGFPQKQAANLATFGIDELTQPYDKDEIAKILARVALGKGRSSRDREYICSELVYECFERAGKVFQHDKRGFISPENIWADAEVTTLARFQ